MNSVWMLVRCLVVFLVFVDNTAIADNGGNRAADLHEWKALVEEAASSHGLRSKRSVDREPEDMIVDIQEHYRKAFEQLETDDDEEEDDDSTSNNEGLKMATMQQNRRRRRNRFGDLVKPVQGRYIVSLDSSLSTDHLYKTIAILQEAYINSDGRLVAKHIKPFHTVGKGFTATLGKKVVALLMKYPYQYSVEQDMALRRRSNAIEQGVEEQTAYSSSNKVPWNLDRLDQHTAHLDGKYNPNGDGKDVDAYILDTGIRYTHKDLEGRAHYLGYDAIDELVGGQERKGADCNSHGTHCAATVGGRKFGVAKKVTLYAARVLNCQGSGAVSGIIHTMEYIVKKRKKEEKTNRAVFSMSLGVERSDAFNNAANMASKEGVVVVAASGNQGDNSCHYSPGSAAQAISVAASDESDRAVSFSNLGSCVTLFAPGASITSASDECDTCTITKSGTSMACPHAAGLAAIILGQDWTLSPEAVKRAMTQEATKDAITIDVFGGPNASVQNTTPNLLLYVPQK